MGLLSWVRWVAVGRRDGLRARIRRTLGFCTWVDSRRSEPAPAPAPGPTPEPEPEPEEAAELEEDLTGWVKVLELSEVAPGEVVEVLAGDRAVAIANVDGEIFALDSVCPHAGGPLGDGHLDGSVLTCPWHGWTFDVRTGKCELADDVHVPSFAARVVRGSVYVAPNPSGSELLD